LPKLQISNKPSGSKVPIEIWVLTAGYTLGFSAIHSFYPNMSKFLQQNFGMTNSEAGHLSSIPYMTASIAVPIFGNILTYAGESHFEKFLSMGLLFVASSQIIFLIL